MEKDVVSAKLDVVFKMLFTKHLDLLKAFVSDILEIPLGDIEELVVTNPELPPENPEGKFSRLDLNMKLKDRLINVEIQINSQADYSDRALFYWAKLFTSELESGEPYKQLKQAITVNIVDFNMFEGSDYHSEVAAVVKGSGKVFSDKLSMHFFELKKVGQRLDPKNRKELWMQFINADSKEELEMLKKTDVPEITSAVNVILDMSEDTKVRELARWREKSMHDAASALKNAEEKGRAAERARTIEILRKMGISEDDIRKNFS